MKNADTRGFTLLEVLFVLGILAVLLTVALPSYKAFLDKSRRTDAMNSLLRMQLQQEKWRGSDIDYATLGEIWSGNDSLEGFYTLAVTVNNAATYTMTAAPKTGTQQVGDSCGTFAVNQGGPFYSGYANAGCWGR